MVGEDSAPLEHDDDDALLCVDECVSDEEQLQEVLSEPVVEATPHCCLEDEQR